MTTKKRRFGQGYKRRSSESAEERETKTTGGFSSLIKEGITLWKPEDGDHHIRIVMPTWNDPDHYGFDVAYSRIGGDRYVRRDSMGFDDDPIAEYEIQLKAAGRRKEAFALAPSHRTWCYIIDRNDEKAGVQLWDCPQSTDREIAKVCKDNRTGARLWLDDPDEGYDLYMRREKKSFKKGKETQTMSVFTAFVVDRYESPIHEDERIGSAWIEFAEKNPIPEVVNVMSAEDQQKIIDAVESSKRSSRDEDTDDDKDTDPRPRTRASSRRPEPEPEPQEEPQPTRRSAPREQPEPDPIDDADADLDEPPPSAGGMQKRQRR